MSPRILPAADAFWRPSNQMGVLNCDLAKQLGAQTLGARMWRLAPGQASTRHRHATQAELYVVLEGVGRIRIDDELHTLEPLSSAYVEPAAVRQVFNDGDADALWLVVGAPPELGEHARDDRRAARRAVPGRPARAAARAGHAGAARAAGGVRVSATHGAQERERLRAAFERLARDEGAERSPLYERICLAMAGDDEVLELLMRAPLAQRRPSLLLAAIHDLLLGGAAHELAAHYPTVAGERVPRGDPGALALRFCREQREGLTRLLETRSTQTNELNRTAAMLPALVHATPAGRSLRLVELGTSAGLNLLVDRYAYRYSGGPAWAFAGTPRVVCDCAIDGAVPPLEPRRRSRSGSASTATRSTSATRSPRAGCARASGPTSPTARPACGPRSRSPSRTRRRSCAATRWRCSASSSATARPCIPSYGTRGCSPMRRPPSSVRWQPRSTRSARPAT